MFLELKTCNKTGNNDVNEVLTNAREALSMNDCGSGSAYVSDVIYETADSYTPIYYRDILDATYVLDYYFSDAIAEGFVCLEGMKGEDINLFKILQSTYYYMIEQDLYENLKDIMWNYCANLANGIFEARIENDGLNPDVVAKLAEKIDSELEDIAENCDNDTFDEVDTKIKELINEAFNDFEDAK